MALLSQYWERVDDVSPSFASCSSENGQGTIPYVLQGANEIDLRAAVPQLLGFTAANGPGNFRLARTLPMGHPIFHYWFADSIGEIRGVGPFTKQDSTENDVNPPEAPPMPFFADYENWFISLHFAPRPYAVIPDTAIPIEDLQWYHESNPNVPILFRYAPEWRRYATFDLLPQNDYITAIAGSSKFQTASMTRPNNAIFNGMPRVFLPNQILRMTWYQVPYRYILSANSYLRKYRGRVNQFPWYEWANRYVFQPGSLLYLGYEPTIYTSPVAQLMNWPGNFISWKYCNITLSFLVTERTGVDLPTPTNKNYLAAGHNLQIFFPKRQFYYVVFNDKEAANVPYFFSCPFEALFTDPDTPQPQAQP